MKTIILGIAAFLFTVNIQAQKNVKSEVKTTVTTVKKILMVQKKNQ
jgi:hypothetical protein